MKRSTLIVLVIVNVALVAAVAGSMASELTGYPMAAWRNALAGLLTPATGLILLGIVGAEIALALMMERSPRQSFVGGEHPHPARSAV
jgi:hypothetical protein